MIPTLPAQLTRAAKPFSLDVLQIEPISLTLFQRAIRFLLF